MEVKVDILKRVEGEGKLLIECENDFVKDIKLSIFELPRFIESLLVGKSFEVLPEITTRICEICPIYQVSDVKAVEYAFNVNISKDIDTLRKLFILESEFKVTLRTYFSCIYQIFLTKAIYLSLIKIL